MNEGEKTPECQLDEHVLCSGPGDVLRPGAPAWEAPVMTVRCGCGCHERPPIQTSPVSELEPIREG